VCSVTCQCGMWDLRVWHHCCWRCKSSRIWCSVIGCLVSRCFKGAQCLHLHGEAVLLWNIRNYTLTDSDQGLEHLNLQVWDSFIWMDRTVHGDWSEVTKSTSTAISHSRTQTWVTVSCFWALIPYVNWIVEKSVNSELHVPDYVLS